MEFVITNGNNISSPPTAFYPHKQQVDLHLEISNDFRYIANNTSDFRSFPLGYQSQAVLDPLDFSFECSKL